MNYMEIEKIIGREILDSRGNPTVETEVHLAGGTIGRGMAPSRTERVEKCNQLLRIEEELGAAAVYPGMDVFGVKR